MGAHLRANLILTALTLLLCAVLYPLALLAVGQNIFPTRASGSLVAGPDGQPVGSRLVAQEFKGDEWFHPRPSAADYNAAASGGSNLSASNPKLRERVRETLKTRSESSNVPADAVTTSGSGLDPHVSSSNAKGQLERVVAAWAAKKKLDPAKVREAAEKALAEATSEPLGGLAGGEAIVNVLEANLALRRVLE